MITTFLWWVIAWTLLGAAIIAITHLASHFLRNAAARHLAWVIALVSVWFFPAYAAVSIMAQKSELAKCAVGDAAVPPTSNTPQALPALLLLAWLGGIVFTMARAIMARRTVGRWYANSADYREMLKRRNPELLASLPTGIELRIALHDELVVPITWGVRKSVVLFPAQANEWESSRLRAVLLHEVAHIYRFDNLTQLFALLTCACHWFNPIVWIAARKMETDSEIAADDFAILHGMKPSNYAQELLSLAAQFSPRTSNSVSTQTAMLKSFTLEHRLLNIINPSEARGPIRLRSVIPLAAIFVGAILAIALVTPRVSASLQPKAPAVPSCLATQSINNPAL